MNDPAVNIRLAANLKYLKLSGVSSQLESHLRQAREAGVDYSQFLLDLTEVEVATRMELRFPDATANPYFAFAVMLAAGLEGMDRGLKVPEPMSIDLYSITPLEREEMGINSLPHDLFEAVKVAEKSEFLGQVLGDDVLRKLVETKLTEADKYRLHVSALELKEHMVL